VVAFERFEVEEAYAAKSPLGAKALELHIVLASLE
jgi:hypothetical protein